MKQMKYLAVAILATVISSNAFAEEKQQEVSVSGNYTNQISPSGGSDILFLNGHYGKYFKPQILGTINVTAATTGSTFNMFGAGVGAKYYFKVGQKGEFVPFADADVMVISMKAGGVSTTPIQIAVGGGASYFLTETASIDGRGSLQFRFSSGANSTQLNITVGLTQRF